MVFGRSGMKMDQKAYGKYKNNFLLESISLVPISPQQTLLMANHMVQEWKR